MSMRMLPIGKPLRIVCLAVVLPLVFIATGSADVTSHFVHEAYGYGTGQSFAGNYLNVDKTIYVDPAVTNWIAWHNLTTPDVVGGQEYVGDYENWLGVDDKMYLTIVNPAGTSSSSRILMDDNGSYGDPSGVQAVIYGTAAEAPNVTRKSFYGSWQYLDEGGLFDSFFDTSGAGKYTFEFEFYDKYSGSYGIPDFYVLVDATPDPIPEPSTLVALISMGLVGLAVVWRRRRRR